MSKNIKDMTDEELKKIMKILARRVDSTIRSQMIMEELIKRTISNKDE